MEMPDSPRTGLVGIECSRGPEQQRVISKKGSPCSSTGNQHGKAMRDLVRRQTLTFPFSFTFFRYSLTSSFPAHHGIPAVPALLDWVRDDHDHDGPGPSASLHHLDFGETHLPHSLGANRFTPATMAASIRVFWALLPGSFITWMKDRTVWTPCRASTRLLLSS
jgi:hypothetical protein